MLRFLFQLALVAPALASPLPNSFISPENEPKDALERIEDPTTDPSLTITVSDQTQRSHNSAEPDDQICLYRVGNVSWTGKHGKEDTARLEFMGSWKAESEWNGAMKFDSRILYVEDKNGHYRDFSTQCPGGHGCRCQENGTCEIALPMSDIVNNKVSFTPNIRMWTYKPPPPPAPVRQAAQGTWDERSWACCAPEPEIPTSEAMANPGQLLSVTTTHTPEAYTSISITYQTCCEPISCSSKSCPGFCHGWGVENPGCRNRIYRQCDFHDLLENFWDSPHWTDLMNGECDMSAWITEIMQSSYSYEDLVGTAIHDFDLREDFLHGPYEKLRARFTLFVAPWLLTFMHRENPISFQVENEGFDYALGTRFGSSANGPACAVDCSAGTVDGVPTFCKEKRWRPRTMWMPEVWNTEAVGSAFFEPHPETGEWFEIALGYIHIDGYEFFLEKPDSSQFARLDTMTEFIKKVISLYSKDWSAHFQTSLWPVVIDPKAKFSYPDSAVTVKGSTQFTKYFSYDRRGFTVSYAEAVGPLMVDLNVQGEYRDFKYSTVCNVMNEQECSSSVQKLQAMEIEATSDAHWFVNEYARIEGTLFSDVLKGDDSNNIFYSGPGGSARMTGRGGADQFIANGGHAIVEDFNPAEGDTVTIMPSAYGIGGKDYLSFYSGLRYEYVDGGYIIQITGTGEPVLTLRNMPQSFNVAHHLNVPGQTCNTNHFGCKNAIYNVDITDSHVVCWAKDTDAERRCANHFDCCDGECIQFSPAHGKQCKGGCRWKMGLCRHDGDCCADLMCIGGLCADLDHGW